MAEPSESITNSWSGDFRAMHALIVGINYSPNHGNELCQTHPRNWTPSPLVAAVADAERITSYLENTLRVPQSQINVLLEKNATRKNIIDGLEKLANNTAIPKNAPIFVYFAGHGGSPRAPPELKSPDRIQCIIPFDYNMGVIPISGTMQPLVSPTTVPNTIPESRDEASPSIRLDNSDATFPSFHPYSGDGTRPSNPVERGDETSASITSDGGDGIYAISDRMLGGLLDRIADEHGNNILVILDCCYSGSGTRGFESEDVGSQLPQDAIARGVEQALPLPPDWQGENTRPRGIDIAPETHTLLSACGPLQRAWEHQGSGLFTRAFLEILRSVQPYHKITYAELAEAFVQRLPKEQRPQFTGPNLQRFLFQRDDSVIHPLFKVLSIDRASRKVELAAGAVHGIPGCRVKITARTENASDPTTLISDPIEAQQPDTLTTTITLPQLDGFTTLEGACLLCPLKVYIEDQRGTPGLPEFLEDKTHPAITLVKEADEDTDLFILFNGEHFESSISFHIDDLATRKTGFCAWLLSCLLPSARRDRLRAYTPIPVPSYTPNDEDVLHMVLAASQYLWHLRRPGTKALFVRDSVNVKVIEVHRRDRLSYYKPVEGHAWPSSSPVKLSVNPNAKARRYYGLEITSEKNCALYVAVFLFNSNFAITRWDLWSGTDAPLQAANGKTSTASLGVGDSVDPLVFQLNSGLPKEDSPFLAAARTTLTSIEPVMPRSATSRDGHIAKSEPVPFIWDAITIPIILTSG